MDKKILDKINSIPIWKGNIDIRKLDGGITNENFLVEDQKDKYVVRIGSDIPEHLISRSNELIASKAAAKCKISPKVIHNDEGVLVLEFIESTTLTDKDIRKKITKINDKILLQYNAMKCASLLRETMWSMVSEISSKIDFDYYQYTQKNIVKFNKAFNSLQI